MASWHQNRYQISISNVNLNEPHREMPPESFQDQSQWTHFYRSNCHLDQQSNSRVIAAAPNRHVPAGSVVPYVQVMENAMSFSEIGLEPRSQARQDGHETIDRKQKRSIKNRESAARSRARKLAYKNELENKVASLEQEVERLTKQKEKETAEKLVVKQDSKGVPIRRINSGPY